MWEHEPAERFQRRETGSSPIVWLAIRSARCGAAAAGTLRAGDDDDVDDDDESS